MPSYTTSHMFFYVYVLEMQDNKRYVGYTHNLKKRVEEYNKGQNFSTKSRLTHTLIYFEGCLNQRDAKRREHYLKGTQGRRFLGIRLKEYTQYKSAFGVGS